MSYFEAFMCPVTVFDGHLGVTPVIPPVTTVTEGDAWFGKDKARYRVSKHKLVLFREFLKANIDE